MTDAPTLSIVVLSWNTKALTLACLRALFGETPRHTREVIVVDNGSSDGSADAIADAYPQVVLVRNAENRLYAEGNNQGAERARGTWLCILNSDTEVRPGALDRMVDFLAEHPDYGAVAPKLVNPDGTVQRACRRFPGLFDPLVDSTPVRHTPPGRRRWARSRMHDFDHESTRDVEQPPGACLVLRRTEYEALGGLDTSLSLFYNDVDLCKRLWNGGRRIRYLAEAEVVHHEGASTSGHGAWNSFWFVNREAYFRKHHGLVGLAWLRFVFWLWTLQVALGITLGPKRLPEKKTAFGELRGHLRACSAKRHGRAA
jgi:GT2 family glycosyltransferase